MLLLCKARLLLALVPFRRWSRTLGLQAGRTVTEPEIRQFVAVVERAAHRLPFETKCLPRSMALSWALRESKIAHSVVLAVRPADRRDSIDALHAWVEIDGSMVLGDLPGPWIETLRLGP